jgi:3-methyladenine DNA glycosylase AlkD
MTDSGRVGEIISDLEAMGDEDNVEGMKRFGIQPAHALGIRTPDLRKYASRMGKDHDLAQQLWATGIHEARHLAAMTDEPAEVTEKQMEEWAARFNTWDICDGVCNNLFYKTSFAWKKALEWPHRKEEYVKRAGFVLMVSLSVHDKKAADDRFRQFFPYLEQEAGDDRKYAKKAVNWALRALGKRNKVLNEEAIKLAETIYSRGSKSARWIASDALRELKSEKIQKRVGK